MPLFMDIHRAEGVSTAAVEEGHRADMHVQGKYGVTYSRYWFNPKAGKIFCLCEAPNADAARRVHKEAHGMVAEKSVSSGHRHTMTGHASARHRGLGRPLGS